MLTEEQKNRIFAQVNEVIGAGELRPQSLDEPPVVAADDGDDSDDLEWLDPEP